MGAACRVSLYRDYICYVESVRAPCGVRPRSAEAGAEASLGKQNVLVGAPPKSLVE